MVMVPIAILDLKGLDQFWSSKFKQGYIKQHIASSSSPTISLSWYHDNEATNKLTRLPQPPQ